MSVASFRLSIQYIYIYIYRVFFVDILRSLISVYKSLFRTISRSLSRNIMPDNSIYIIGYIIYIYIYIGVDTIHGNDILLLNLHLPD